MSLTVSRILRSIVTLILYSTVVSSHAAPYLQGGTIDLIQTSHQDLGWPNGPAAEARDDNKRIDAVLNLFQQSSTVDYLLEKAYDLKTYEEASSPDQVDAIKAAIESGRFEMGAAYSSPYEELISGELLARQFYFGRKYFRSLFPRQDALVYMAPDPPHCGLQTAQVLEKAGVPYEFRSRDYGTYPGIPNDAVVRCFSPDGSSALMYAEVHYYHPDAVVNNLSDIDSIRDYVDISDAYFSSHQLAKHLPLILDKDNLYPQNYDDQIVKWNNWASANGYPAMRYSTLQQSLGSIAAGNMTQVDKVTGERPNLWLYEAAPTNHLAVSYQREGSMLASAAESFATFRSMLEGNYTNYPQAALTDIWRQLDFACHGWARQETCDAFTNTFKTARDAAESELKDALTWIAKKIKTRAVGTPLVVYNALSWKRAGDVVISDIPDGVKAPFSLIDSNGVTLSYQFIDGDRIAFIASEIPAYGYRTYYLVSGGRATKEGSVLNSEWTDAFESAYYKITPVPGGLSSVYDKQTGKELLDTSKYMGAELLEMDSNGGMGAGESTSFPYVGKILDRSTLHDMKWTCTEDGPVRRAYETSCNCLHFQYKLKLLIYNDIKRIDFEPSIVNWDGTNNLELRMEFPLNSITKDVAYDVPFGIVKVGLNEINPSFFGWGAGHQPRETQNFIYGGGDGFGVTLSSSVAAIDYVDPGSFDGARDVACGPDGTIAYLGESTELKGNIHVLDANHHWNEVPGETYVGALAVAGQEHFWIVKKDGTVSEYDNSAWTERKGVSAQAIACGPEGMVACVGTASESNVRKVYKWNGNSWDEIAGNDHATRVAIAKDGHLWVVNTDGTISEYDGSNWTQRGVNAKDVSCGADGTICYVGTDSGIYRWNETSWVKVPDGTGSGIGVDAGGRIWVVNNEGMLWEYANGSWTQYLKPDPVVPSQTILQPILLATRKSCAGNFNWSQKGTHNFRFSIYSHEQGVENGDRVGMQFNNPLIAVAPGPRDEGANLPETNSFAAVDHSNIVISAIKKAEDDNGVVVRMFDDGGIDSTINLKFMAPLKSAEKTSLIEENGSPLVVNGTNVNIPVGHHAIETFKLNVGP